MSKLYVAAPTDLVVLAGRPGSFPTASITIRNLNASIRAGARQRRARCGMLNVRRFEGCHMSSAILEKLRLEALRLSDRERAEQAHELVKGLDGPVDADAAEAWEKEILRRLAEVDSGTATLIDREELRRRMRTRMSGK